MKRTFLTVPLLLAAGLLRAQTPAMKKYIPTPTGFLMVLHQGDSVMKEIDALASAEALPSASLNGFGFVNVRFGFFNFKTREYEPKDFSGVELGSMTGSIAWQNGRPSIHLHGVAAGPDFKAVGGHILDATVSTGSLEITVLVHDRKLERRRDEELGANVLGLD
jgi:uncharacterized protein